MLSAFGNYVVLQSKETQSHTNIHNYVLMRCINSNYQKSSLTRRPRSAMTTESPVNNVIQAIDERVKADFD